MARTRTKLKIDRLLLLEKTKAARQKIVDNHAKDSEAYDGRVAVFAEKLAAELRQAAIKIETDPSKALDITKNDWNGGCFVKFKANIPARPELKLRDLDRLIRTLEAASDETISVSADDDFAAYL